MPKLSKLLAGLLFVAMIAVLPAAAQMSGIAGQVTGVDGKPLAGAIVQFTRTDIAGHYQVKTDKKGHFGHYGLPLGTYDLALVDNGKTLYTLNQIKTHPGDPQQIDINLQKEAAAHQQETQQVQQQLASGGEVKAPKGMSKEDAQKYEEAVKKQQAEIKKIGQLNALLQQNKQYVDAQQWDQAVKTMEQAVAMDQTHDILYANLGQDYVGAKQYDKAVDAFQKAIALKPNDAGYYINLGNAYSKAGKNDEAAAQFAKAAQLDPANAKTAYFNEAAVFYNAGKMDEASKAIDSLLQVDPNNPMGWYLKGQILLGKASVDPKTGSPIPVPGTVEAFQKYLDLAPTGPYADSVKSTLQLLTSQVQTSYKKQTTTKKHR